MTRRTCLSTLLVVAFSQYAALAQTPDTASIQGHVVDQSHSPVDGVKVTITNSLTGLARSVQSNSDGVFTVTGLPVAATYNIRVTKEKFAEAKLNNFSVGGGATADIELQLNVAGGKTQITVTGVTGEVRTDAPQLGERIAGRQLEETPMLNRRITFLPLLNSANRPAINQGDVFMNELLFTTNGAGRRQASFDVDGSSGNDGWGRQTIFTNIPHAAVQEMTILENSFSAEYGGSTGSSVNVVTRTGTNRFRLTLIEDWRPAATEAALSGFNSSNAASGNDVSSDTLGQTALSGGGPLGHDEKTHIFAAGEFSRENRASPIISPVAPGSFVGHYRDWMGFLRLDRQLNDKNSLFLRSNYDGFYDTNPNGIVGGNSLPSVARTFRRKNLLREDIRETCRCLARPC